MKTKHLIIIASTLLVFSGAFNSCTHQKQIAGNYEFETECMGIELDGSQTLKAWGYGRNRRDAVAQAKKNAVRDIIFKGIRKGRSECTAKPLVSEVNAQEKYEDYFNKFFADGGMYDNFISMEDESIIPWIAKDRKHAGHEVYYGVIVRVLRAELKQQLIKDNIIK